LRALLERNPEQTQPLAGARIIDVGCWAGPLSRLGAEVLGIDASGRNVTFAKRHARLSDVQVRYRHLCPRIA
jgi:2-polyprenyl-6-hydroxyphenyl methylase / 3-demethylubiquinone-9 3-methyltransferase